MTPVTKMKSIEQNIEEVQNCYGKAYRVTVRNGISKKYIKTFNNLKSAKEFRDRIKFQKKMSRGQIIDIKMSSYLMWWLKNLKVSPSTYSNYKISVENDIIPVLGKYCLRDIDLILLKRAFSEMEERVGKKGRKKHNAGLNRVRSCLHKAFNDAKKEGYVGGNIVSDLSKYAENEYNALILSKEQINIFLSHINGRRFWILFFMCLNLGIRIGESIALAWDKLDLVNGIAEISRTYERVSGVVVNRTKSRKRRYIGLGIHVLDVLKKWRAQHLDCQYLYEENGIHASIHPVYKCFKRYLKDTGLPNIRIHDLRHAYATHYCINGGDLRELRDILGHSSIVTCEHYTKLAKTHIENGKNVVIFQIPDNSKNNVIELNQPYSKVSLKCH